MKHSKCRPPPSTVVNLMSSGRISTVISNAGTLCPKRTGGEDVPEPQRWKSSWWVLPCVEKKKSPNKEASSQHFSLFSPHHLNKNRGTVLSGVVTQEIRDVVGIKLRNLNLKATPVVPKILGLDRSFHGAPLASPWPIRFRSISKLVFPLGIWPVLLAQQLLAGRALHGLDGDVSFQGYMYIIYIYVYLQLFLEIYYFKSMYIYIYIYLSIYWFLYIYIYLMSML